MVTKPSHAGASSRDATNRPRPHFLICDDEPRICEMVSQALADVAECDVAFNGADALSLLNAHRYDLLLLDLKMPKLEVKMNPVTSATRIPLMANGTVDMECGSTTNNIDRQKQVSFLNTTFVTANRIVAKKSSNVKVLNDLKGKPLVSTAGTTNLKQVTELNGSRNLGMNVMSAKDHAEAFLMVETDRAAAFAMDDILLYSLVAGSKSPSDYLISAEALSVEPYGIMVRKDDAAFKKVGDDAIAALFKSGEINKIYAKWFQAPIPPKNINLNLPMSEPLKKVVAKPTDSGDPAAYQ